MSLVTARVAHARGTVGHLSRHWPLAVLVTALITVAGISTLAQARTSAHPSRDVVNGNGPARSSRVTGRIAWRHCGQALQCARVRVPLDWDHPRGPQIKLAVIRHLASKSRPTDRSLFFNPGGPGGSFDTVKDGGKRLEELDAEGGGRFNVVGWDPRGVGRSTHVRCFRSEKSQARFFRDWAIPTTRSASPPYVRKTRALARRCGKLSGSLLRHISTADTARDLDYLRRLVGDRRLNYYGISAGTFLGQTYANMFPNRVRAIVLDGVVDPVAFTKGNKAGFVDMLSTSVRGFEGFESLCESAGPGRCALAGHGSVAARVDELFARLRQTPLPAPTATPPGQVTYGDALQAIVVGMSSGPQYWPEMASELEAAAKGDGSRLLTDSRDLTRAFTEGSPGLPAMALICADSPSRQGPGQWPRVIDQLTRVSYIYGPVISWWRWAPCASWPAHSADRYTGPWNATTKNPVLVIGTDHDPNTPFANARRAARRLGNAVLLTHDGYSHTSPPDPSACVNRAITGYLVHLITPRRGTVCPSNRQPFDPNFGQPLP
jgi:pimeloyl-ACP methyl ester carboxylesterase